MFTRIFTRRRTDRNMDETMVALSDTIVQNIICYARYAKKEKAPIRMISIVIKQTVVTWNNALNIDDIRYDGLYKLVRTKYRKYLDEQGIE